MINPPLSEETQGVLLLCGRFGDEKSGAQPFSAAEYNRFARWLLEQNLRPATLLDADPEWLLEKIRSSGFDPARLTALLRRGGALAIAVEQWTNSGLWVVSRGDSAYPEKLKERLKQNAPPLLYGAGDIELLKAGGLAVVGSRDASETALAAARTVGERGAELGQVIISGGARGVDSAAMRGALETGGQAVGVLGDSLLKEATAGKFRDDVRDGRLCLISSNHPRAIFNVGAAMERNKLIYALSGAAFVMSADLAKGGTWHGATENLEQRWVPLLVWESPDMLEGNRALLKRGGIALTAASLESSAALGRKIAEAQATHQTTPAKPGGEQTSLLPD